MIKLNEVKVASFLHSCFHLQDRQFYKNRVLGVFSVERPPVLQGQSAWCVWRDGESPGPGAEGRESGGLEQLRHFQWCVVFASCTPPAFTS